MGWNDHIDFELHDLVSDAVDGGYIEEGTPAYGVALQAIDQGCDRLSDKQRWIYGNHVLPALKSLQASRDAEARRELLDRDD